MNDSDLRSQFESQTLPRAEWTHRSHVRMAFLYLREHSYEDAVRRMRQGILALNAAHATPEGPSSGYNETTTQAFMRIIAATMAAYETALSAPDSEAFCQAHPQLLHPQVLRLFYSPQRRMLPEAKHSFIEPDLAPLPQVRSPPKS